MVSSDPYDQRHRGLARKLYFPLDAGGEDGARYVALYFYCMKIGEGDVLSLSLSCSVGWWEQMLDGAIASQGCFGNHRDKPGQVHYKICRVETLYLHELFRNIAGCCYQKCFVQTETVQNVLFLSCSAPLLWFGLTMFFLENFQKYQDFHHTPPFPHC